MTSLQYFFSSVKSSFHSKQNKRWLVICQCGKIQDWDAAGKREFAEEAGETV